MPYQLGWYYVIGRRFLECFASDGKDVWVSALDLGKHCVDPHTWIASDQDSVVSLVSCAEK